MRRNNWQYPRLQRQPFSRIICINWRNWFYQFQFAGHYLGAIKMHRLDWKAFLPLKHSMSIADRMCNHRHIWNVFHLDALNVKIVRPNVPFYALCVSTDGISSVVSVTPAIFPQLICVVSTTSKWWTTQTNTNLCNQLYFGRASYVEISCCSV